jgi:hypothetical protein
LNSKCQCHVNGIYDLIINIFSNRTVHLTCYEMYEKSKVLLQTITTLQITVLQESLVEWWMKQLCVTSGSLMPSLLSVENWVPLKPVLWACGMLHLFIISHVQTQSNQVCNFHVILLWLMLLMDHFVSRLLNRENIEPKWISIYQEYNRKYMLKTVIDKHEFYLKL